VKTPAARERVAAAEKAKTHGSHQGRLYRAAPAACRTAPDDARIGGHHALGPARENESLNARRRTSRRCSVIDRCFAVMSLAVELLVHRGWAHLKPRVMGSRFESGVRYGTSEQEAVPSRHGPVKAFR